MIYLKDKEGNVIGKKSPSQEQMKVYKANGFIECDEKGNSKSKPKAKKTKKK